MEGDYARGLNLVSILTGALRSSYRMRYNIHMLTTAAAAIKLKVIPRRIRQLIETGQLRAQRIGRDYLIEPASVAEYAKRRKPAGRPTISPK
jgi:excisionase family DNA binding protein